MTDTNDDDDFTNEGREGIKQANELAIKWTEGLDDKVSVATVATAALMVFLDAARQVMSDEEIARHVVTTIMETAEPDIIDAS